MSTPIFDELLREFAGRMEEHPLEPPAQVPPPVPAAPATPASRRHRAE